MKVISNAKHFYPKVEWRTEVYPTESLPNPFWIYDFTSKELKKMLEYGEADAVSGFEKVLNKL